jgi:glycogen operon protein
VDGFRFDLASTLGRPRGGTFDRDSAMLTAITTDPVLSRRKLIAEPWDATGDGYRVGEFGAQWAEWNGRYRDTIRDFWRGATGVRDLAYRLSGSSDLYDHNLRRPWQSINFVTAHDGFTLQDLVSYNEKHNEANGEDSRDGSNDNRSWNCGVEGPTADPAVRKLRTQQKRNLIASLLLSQGVPMVLAGDELGRTQQGNNNAYCQDSDLSYINWKLGPEEEDFLEFVAHMIGLRRRHAVFSRRRFLRANAINVEGLKEIVWLTPEGSEMTETEWNQHFARCLGVYLAGAAIERSDKRGRPVTDNNFMLLFNAHHEEIPFVLPQFLSDKAWWTVLDTAAEAVPFEQRRHEAGTLYPLQGRSLALLRETAYR